MAERTLRCAVYTRKSTEDGLEQEFNSLDAQYEACAAYALSQRHEGWVLNPERYDDGGFSGGNMQRPGLVRLLADVAAGKVDIILVYKIDRLTRSLADFAKIVDVLDEAKWTWTKRGTWRAPWRWTSFARRIAFRFLWPDIGGHSAAGRLDT